MTLMARYSGTCPDCGGRWQPGDLIRSEGARDDGPTVLTPRKEPKNG